MLFNSFDFLIFFVVVFAVQLVLPRRPRNIFLLAASYFFYGGWAGVDLFFVLSGFLVGGLLFKEASSFGKIRFRRFLIRRAFKIYPAFYAMLSFTVVYRWLFVPDFDAARTASEVFFLQNYYQPIWSHTWSLAVEEHFYIFLPLVFLACGRNTDFGKLCERVVRVGLCVCVCVYAVPAVSDSVPTPSVRYEEADVSHAPPTRRIVHRRYSCGC